MQFRKLHLWILLLLSSSGDMSSRIGFDDAEAGDFRGPLLTGAATGVRAGAAVVAGGNATAVAFGENEMNLGRLPPGRAVTRTMALRLFSRLLWQAVAEEEEGVAVTLRRPEVDNDSGEDGGVKVCTD